MIHAHIDCTPAAEKFHLLIEFAQCIVLFGRGTFAFSLKISKTKSSMENASA